MALYAEIKEIVAPGEAVAGSEVDIIVRIENLYTATFRIMVSGALEYGTEFPWPLITFDGDQVDTPAGWIAEFSGHFTMPDSDVIIHAYSYWYGSDETFHPDDKETRDVKLAELVPTFSEFRVSGFSKV